MKRPWLLGMVLLASTVASQERKLLETLGPFGTYGHVYDNNSIEAMRARVMGTHGVISTGHYLSTLAGISAFKKGGNAFDAGVTAAMALKVMKMGYAGWTGVAPLILYSAEEGRVVTLSGGGGHGRDLLPDGFNQSSAIDGLGCVIVAARGQALLAIARHRVGGQGDDRTGVAFFPE